MLEGFVRAFAAGDVAALVELLANDCVLVTDGGPEGRSEAGLRNLKKPLHGAEHVAAFVIATSRAAKLPRPCSATLNGRPALVFFRDGAPFAGPPLGRRRLGRSSASSSTPILDRLDRVGARAS